MARLQKFSLAVSLMSLAPQSRAFVPTPPGVLKERIHAAPVRETQLKRACRTNSCRWGPRPLLASAKPDVKDTKDIISEMEDWARLITPETHIKRNFKYIVSEGTSLPEVFFDFWKAISAVIDEQRATGENQSFRKLVMFVAPFCEELNDYETMEHTHQLLQQSARDGGCEDFGKSIIHLHYHPNYRHRPRPKETRMASRHSPHPAFSIDVMYRSGGLKSLASIRAVSEAEDASASSSPPRPRADVPAEGRSERARKKNEEWAAKTRTSLEKVYRMAASYGAEDTVTGSSTSNSAHPLAGKGVPESSQEILQLTQGWVRSVLKEAAESDAAATTSSLKKSGDNGNVSPVSADAPSTAATSLRGLATDRSTSFNPPSAMEAAAAAAAAAAEEAAAGTQGTSSATATSGGGDAPQKGSAPRLKTAAGGIKQAFSHAAERVTVREEARRGGAIKEKEEENRSREELLFEEEDEVAGVVLMPGKELVKRMQDISQYIVARAKTAEEAYGDVWEVIREMADRAARRGCSVPTEDYSSTSAPCYGALMVTPDMATYSSDAFFRFQETLNRGLKHLPMEHDISVEAFHPEAVSDSSPLDHRFTRSPFPTLHICYHGLRAVDTPMYPRAPSKAAATATATTDDEDGGDDGRGRE